MAEILSEMKGVPLGRARRGGRRRKDEDHETRRKLIETAATLLDEWSLSEITSAMVLAASGVSKGSLYHHFQDFDDLMGEAAIRRFSALADRDIMMTQAAIATATDVSSLVSALAAITSQSQADTRRPRRMERARMIAYSELNPRLAERLASEQMRLTNAFREIFTDAQCKGWLARDVDPHAASVMIQAYTFGRLIDDITEDRMSHDAWIALIDRVVRLVFAAPQSERP